jgi:CHAT domain-containing protein
MIKDAGFPFQAYQGKARALIALRHSAEARTVLHEALTEARAQKDHAAEAQLLVVAGNGAREYGEAIQYLKSANSLSEEGGFHHVFAWSAMELAKRYVNAGDLEAAETYATKGLKAMPELEDKYHLPQHVALLADLKAKRGKFEEANRLFERAADVIDAVLITAPSRQIASSLISTLSDVYIGHFELAVRSRDTAKAYEILERARGRSLADSLRDERRIEPLRDPVTLTAQKDINRIQLALLHETDRASRQHLLDQLFETEQVFTPIGRPSSPVRAAVTHFRTAPLAALQSDLHPDEAVLEYVLAEPRSYCIRITRAHSNILVLPDGRQRIEQTIDAYLAEIRAKRPATEAGQRLHAMLLEPVLGHNDRSRLTVVPDGKLNFLPLDSLVGRDGLRILESHVVSYCPSGTVLHLMRSSVRPRNHGLRFLGVGDVQYAAANAPVSVAGRSQGSPGVRDFLGLETSDPFAEIPHTRDEVIAASQAIGSECKLLLGRDATEAAVKSQPLESFDVIHIATHGVASAEFPDRAALVLSSDPHGHEDGLLQAREIRNLPLRTELLTLSACDTGLGTLEGQEGVANLIRAFLFAGTRSVVASLWKASDVYTAHLMSRFYGYLAKGTDRSAALQRAKIDSMREFGRNAAPFYWAGFVIVGEGSGCVLCPEPPALAQQARRVAASQHPRGRAHRSRTWLPLTRVTPGIDSP